DDFGTIKGTFGTGTSTDDTRPLLNGTVSGLQTGDFVRIYDGATLLGTATLNTTKDGWTYQVTSNLAETAHTLKEVITDVAGNEAPSITFTQTTTNTPPTNTLHDAPPIYDDFGTIKGTFGTGTSTDDTKPLLNGTVSGLQTGDFVRIYDGATLLG